MEEIQKQLIKYNQQNLLKQLLSLNELEKQSLKFQLEKVDFELMQKLYEKTKQNSKNMAFNISQINNVYVKKDMEESILEQWKMLGKEEVLQGKFGVVTMAGGQGTRLGFNKPKGTYVLNVCDKQMSIFEILILKLKEAKAQLGVTIPWYIMTSRENNKDTVDFFEENGYFGYGKENVIFFEQAELPMQDKEGNIIMEGPEKIKFAANGNGGVFKAICDNVLSDMKNRGIQYLYFSGVDNILVNFVDLEFLGGIIYNKQKAGSKSILKEKPEEKVGIICSKNGKPSVVEYSELSQEMATFTKPNGELVYSEANIVSNIFSIDIIEKGKELPYHIAIKSCEILKADGSYAKELAYKYEMFIFDIYNFLDDLFIFRVEREKEFAPIKNKEGEDSPETAAKLYNNNCMKHYN